MVVRMVCDRVYVHREAAVGATAFLHMEVKIANFEGREAYLNKNSNNSTKCRRMHICVQLHIVLVVVTYEQ